MGAKTVALDIAEEKLAFARKLGAEITVNTSNREAEAVRGEIQAESKGAAADLFVDLVGTAESQKYAMTILGPAGKLLQLGYSKASYTNLPVKDVVLSEMQVVGSLASTVNDLREITELVEEGRIMLDVTAKYRLQEINTALEDLEHNRIVGRSVIISGSS